MFGETRFIERTAFLAPFEQDDNERTALTEKMARGPKRNLESRAAMR
jgi:hypothetical protein